MRSVLKATTKQKASPEPQSGAERKKKMADWEKMADMIREAYVKVMGVEKWNSLSDQQKRDVVMIIAKDMNSRL